MGERCLLLKTSAVSQEAIYTSAELIKVILSAELMDIVPSYDTIAVFTKSPIEQVVYKLTTNKAKVSKRLDFEKVEVPVCYEVGQDLPLVAKETSLSQEEVIEKHLGAKYSVALVGFTPGFLYLSGLPEELSCPRKKTPRRMIEIGSVGIGGSQAGVYSLPSPGGWNIIGRTPIKLFEREKMPPMRIGVGTKLEFKRISKTEFEKWGS